MQNEIFQNIYGKLQIRSHLGTKVIESSTLKKAVEKFRISDFRQWDCDLDEINTNKIF